MSRFRNPIDSVLEHRRRHTCPGSSERLTYSPVYDDNGAWHLEVTGKEDLYLEIQSWKDSCDINVLMKRYAQGDVGALQRRQAMYMDVTQFPTSYAAMLNTINNAHALFDSLDLEARSQFDHDFNKFVASMDNMEDFLGKLGIKPNTPAADPAPAGGEGND